jgi:spermidine/putrescine transport system ATP-binding protein
VADATEIISAGDGVKPRAIELLHLRKTYGAVVAVADVDLVIDEASSSRCWAVGLGTTVPRMIAGFERPDSSTVLLGEATSPLARTTTMNTSSRTTHCSAHDRAGERRVRPAREGVGRLVSERAAEMLDTVRLGEYGSRRRTNSGGQRRASRSPTREPPQVLLLDEPLSALDLKLREEMQIGTRLTRRGVTFVFVARPR